MPADQAVNPRTKKIAIIDYGGGNVWSVSHALQWLGYASTVTSSPAEIRAADAYILPGVGAFGQAMKQLNRSGLPEVLREQVLGARKPFLGICLGMQLLAEDSDEMGHHTGLGWIPGHVVRIQAKPEFRLPHVGWNGLEIRRREPLFLNIDEGSHFFFDHSYQFICDAKYVSAVCQYGPEITVALQHENIFAIQCHPEKSQTRGLRFLRNYLNFVEQATGAQVTAAR